MSWTCENCGVEVDGKSGLCWNCGITRWPSKTVLDFKYKDEVTRECQKQELESKLADAGRAISLVLSFAAYVPMLFSVKLSMDQFSIDISNGRGAPIALVITMMFCCLGLSIVSLKFSLSASVRFLVAGFSPVVLYLFIGAWWQWYLDFHAAT